MTVVFPLDLPTTGRRRFELVTANVVALSISPFTLQTQIHEHAGNAWAADVTLPVLNRAEAEEWAASLISLRGRVGTFRLGDVQGALPRGTPNGPGKVNAGGQTGFEIVTKDWTPNITGLFLRGDFIQIVDRLYKIVKDVNSDGSGNATLDIWPSLRESPIFEQTIITTNTTGLFRLTENVWRPTIIDPNVLYSIRFAAEEAI